jgi:hypothetical protein
MIAANAGSGKRSFKGLLPPGIGGGEMEERKFAANAGDDVQGHSRYVSDETLKQAIAEVQGALARLRELEDGDDVQGHSRYMSDETLKQAITEVQGALARLRELEDGDDVQGHSRYMSDETLKRAVTSLTGALGTLKAIATQPRA